MRALAPSRHTEAKLTLHNSREVRNGSRPYKIGEFPMSVQFQTCHRIWGMHSYTVSLRISSRELDISQITRELGLTPTQTRARGEHRSGHTVWDESMWEFEVLPEGQSDWNSLEAGLEVLLNIFFQHAKTIREYRNTHDVSIWCGHFSSSFDGGPSLSAEMLKSLGDFGVPLWIDTYFSKNPH
jgi:hypothetical protein